jgi:hypothetical protein
MKQIAINGLTYCKGPLKPKATLKPKVSLDFLEGHFKTEVRLAISTRTSKTK